MHDLWVLDDIVLKLILPLVATRTWLKQAYSYIYRFLSHHHGLLELAVYHKLNKPLPNFI